MPGGGSKPGERRGGRKKGSVNFSTRELGAKAEEPALEVLDRLIALFLDETKPGEVRIKAGKIILERGYGKVS